jgi:glutathione S-transferase
MLRILGRNNSSNVQKVLWCCDELSIPYRREDFGGPFGKVDDSDYMALNPNSRVPTIVEDDGFSLWESNAITRYLADKYGKGGLMPRDPRQRADADRWMDWQQTTVLPFMTPIFWGLVRTAEADRDMDAINGAITTGAAVFQILENHLSDKDYIVGNRLTVADIPNAIMVYRWFALVENGPDFPAIRAWYARMSACPGFKKHVLDLPLT